MAFKVEDGGGYSDSNSFASTSYLDAYCADRGITTQSAWTETRKQQNLVKATAYISSRFRARFKGDLMTPTQALPFPRFNIRLEDGENTLAPVLSPSPLPRMLLDATCELALVADASDLAPNIKSGANAVKTKKIGPLEIQYQGPYNPNTIWQFAFQLLRPLVRRSGVNLPMERS